MSALIEAYVTNLGKYAEYGVEAGETLKFPATTEEVQALLTAMCWVSATV